MVAYGTTMITDMEGVMMRSTSGDDQTKGNVELTTATEVLDGILKEKGIGKEAQEAILAAWTGRFDDTIDNKDSLFDDHTEYESLMFDDRIRNTNTRILKHMSPDSDDPVPSDDTIVHMIINATDEKVKRYLLSKFVNVLKSGSLGIWSSSPDTSIRSIIARSSNLDYDQMQALSQDPIPSIRGTIARYQSLTEELFDKFMNDTTVITDPGIDDDPYQYEFGKDYRYTVRSMLAFNDCLDDVQADAIVHSDSPYAVCRILEHHVFDIDDIDLVVNRHRDEWGLPLMRAIACNQPMSTGLFAWFRDCPDSVNPRLYYPFLVQNPCLSEKQIDSFIEDIVDTESVRTLNGMNPNDRKRAHGLRSDTAIINRNDLTESQFNRLLEAKDPFVIAEVLMKANPPVSINNRFMKHHDPLVRRMIATHANLTDEQSAILSVDNDPMVKATLELRTLSRAHNLR
jgi:hypothetical protein